MSNNRTSKEHLKKFRSYMPGITEWHGYSCNFCGTMYKTHQDAERCFKQGFNPRLKEGDIVAQRYALENNQSSHGWYNGEDEWVLFDRPDGGLHGGRSVAFYYVVTKVMSYSDLKKDAYRGAHAPVYVVLTLGIKRTDGSPHIGWTQDDGHIFMSHIDDPPDIVVQQSKEFLGRTVGPEGLL